MNRTSTHYPSLLTLITVFFFWGFLGASNGIFIPFCKAHFHLSQLESQLIDSAFYGAYFIGSLVLYLISAFTGKDLLNKWGYKKSIILGLLLSIVGALLMIPSVNAGSFPLILGSLFVIALGFSLQQTAAQPFAISLGPEETGADRLNLGGGINSFGTTIGPLIVSLVLFGSIASDPSAADIGSINMLYMMLSAVFLLVVLIFTFRKMESNQSIEPVEKSFSATMSLIVMTLIIISLPALGYFIHLDRMIILYTILAGVLGILLYAYFVNSSTGGSSKAGWGALQYPQLALGMIAIFVYVGVEVSIQSNMGALLKEPAFGGYDEANISPFISLYWGSLMIGRWTGAIAAFNLSKMMKTILKVVVPALAFGVIMGVNLMKGNSVDNLLIYIVCVAVLVAGFFLAQEKPVRTLMLFSGLAIVAMVVGLLTTGELSMFAFISGGLFCSIMWPCIFSLSIAGLGKYQGQGSAFLIMMILGGAVIPPLQGGLADTLGIHHSYIVTVFCFAYLLFFAWKVQGILKARGVDYDSAVGGGH